MTNLPPFDPTSGTNARSDSFRAVFPDVEELIKESIEGYGVCDEYLVAQVPNTSVFVLYGLDHAAKRLVLVQIRTYKGSPN